MTVAVIVLGICIIALAASLLALAINFGSRLEKLTSIMLAEQNYRAKMFEAKTNSLTSKSMDSSDQDYLDDMEVGTSGNRILVTGNLVQEIDIRDERAMRAQRAVQRLLRYYWDELSMSTAFQRWIYYTIVSSGSTSTGSIQTASISLSNVKISAL